MSRSLQIIQSWGAVWRHKVWQLHVRVTATCWRDDEGLWRRGRRLSCVGCVTLYTLGGGSIDDSAPNWSRNITNNVLEKQWLWT